MFFVEMFFVEMFFVEMFFVELGAAMSVPSCSRKSAKRCTIIAA